jgi:PIN domain nuclease of toxin-antitoxin system
LIIDTTYLLPLSRIGIDTDLLKAMEENKIKLDLDDFSISSISIFELQAKAAKLEIQTNFTVEAVEVIDTVFKIQPFYNQKVIKISYELLSYIKDYIDCIIVATAIALGEDLITEDSKIHDKKELIKKKYKINILNYHDLIKDRGQ